MSFMDWGEEFYFRTGELLNPLRFVEVDESLLVKVQPEQFVRLQTGASCRDYSVVEYTRCLVDLATEENGGKVCSDVTSEPYFPGVPFCQPMPYDTNVTELTEASQWQYS